MSNFIFNIGDVVASKLMVEEFKLFTRHTDQYLRPVSLIIEERISVECIGGTQLFYTCRDYRGAVEKHPEAALVPGTVLWDAWLNSVQARDAEKDNLKTAR